MPETSFISFILSKYRAVELLGKGGFGTVYRAIDTTLDREVALKVLHPQLVADPSFVERFRTEAKIIAALRHPNVVGVYELGDDGGRLFIAMEYMPGGTLKDRLAQRGRLSFDETLTILQQVCAGLDAAHAKGMIHRDIKPGNVLFDANGNAVVGDFGLARAMQLSSIASASSSAGGVGTPFYKAPELWRGKPPASPATDVYALTCMVYEMLTGCVLFNGDTPDEVLTKHLIDGPDFGANWPPSDAPIGLTEVLQHGIARNPDERYASAKALADALLSLRAQPQKSVVVTTPAIDVAAPAKHSMQPSPNNKSKLPIWGMVMAGAAAILLIGAMLGQAGNGNSLVAVAPTQIMTSLPIVEILSSETPTLEPTPTYTPAAKPSDTPTLTVTPKPSATSTLTPSPTSTASPTVRPTLTFTPRPSPVAKTITSKSYKIYWVGSDLYSSESTGANPRKIGDTRVWGEDLSPSTTKLTFRYELSPGQCDYYTMNIDGTNLLPITNGLGCLNLSPHWSADSKTVIYSNFKDIYSVNYDGTNLRNLTNSPEDDCCIHLSPNRQKILFKTSLRFTQRPDGKLIAVSILQVMNSDGTNKKIIAPDNDSAQYMFYWRDNARVSYEIPSDGTVNPANAGKFTVDVR